jgi:hypothetical protein
MTQGHKIIVIFIVMAGFIIYGSEALAMPESMPEAYSKVNIEYKAENLPDPFIDYKAEEALEASQRPAELKPLPPLVVQGMVWGGNFSQAIINGKIVKVGESIEGVRITEINKEGIVVLFDNQLYKIASPAKINYGNLKKSQEGGKK